MIEGGVQVLDVQIATKSDIGVVRKENQDSFLVCTPSDEFALRSRGRLFAVADGMGGLRDGRAASELTIKTLEKCYFTYPGDASEALVLATEEANRVVFERSAEGDSGRPMGSTSTALALLPDSACIAHVGDSRVYRYRRGELRQITRDHSLANELRDQGVVVDDLLVSMHKNVLTRGIGLSEEIDVDLYELGDLERGDLFLISSDGLHDVVGDALLVKELRRSAGDLDSLCDRLIEAARQRGGPDNITVIAIRVGRGDPTTIPPLQLEGETSPSEPRGPSHRGARMTLALVLAFALGAVGTRLWDSIDGAMTRKSVLERIDELLDQPDERAAETAPEVLIELRGLRELLEN